MNDPLLLLLTAAGGLWAAWLWLADLRAARAGQPNPRAFPGATSAPTRALVIAALGVVALTLAETWGEKRLGLAAAQSHLTVLFAAYSVLVAPLVEELIFRGFIVIESRGAAAKWAAAVGASLVFAGLHPFLWEWTDQQPFRLTLLWEWIKKPPFELTLTPKGWFSTGAVFASSLWFYAMRFSARLNPHGSLLPCFAAHSAKNLAVVAVKLAQGFVSGWW
jgi:membrane protease YdiL (CAAX protease family)